ncbi:Homeodomain-like protein, partial [Testicularia cyperi]
MASYNPYGGGYPDSRYCYLNPFEVKHRRRTTKTQFKLLESTFHETPKPSAALRKQLSVQLDMPQRAVQIWFQNRRAKAK